MAKAKENVMVYNGYHGSIEFSLEDEILFGRVLYIRDVVVYQGSALSELRRAFMEAVDSYLADCREEGLEPNKPFSGTFNVRIASDLHRRAAIEADRRGISLNKYLEEALRAKVNGEFERVSVDVTQRPMGFAAVGDSMLLQGSMSVTIAPIREYNVQPLSIESLGTVYENNSTLQLTRATGISLTTAKRLLT